MKVKINILAYLSCLIILFLSMGYAILSESLTFEATGIIGTPSKEKFNDVILSNELPTLNMEDGLYSYNSKYYFSGININNYVSFNEEIWRIISIEEDGSIKIIKDTVIDINKINQIEEKSNFWLNNTSDYIKGLILKEGRVLFDFKGRRPLNTTLENSYCINTYNGCNAYDKGIYQEQIVEDASLLKIYLETQYFPNMTEKAQQQVQNYTLNIGIVETNKKIDTVLSSEQNNTTSSFIGLPNISDYVYATQDITCRNSFDKDACANSNWLFLTGYQYYLINGKKTSTNAQMWTVDSNGKITSQDANNRFYLRPIVVLNKNITATGTGSIDDMYILGDIL